MQEQNQTKILIKYECGFFIGDIVNFVLDGSHITITRYPLYSNILKEEEYYKVYYVEVDGRVLYEA